MPKLRPIPHQLQRVSDREQWFKGKGRDAELALLSDLSIGVMHTTEKLWITTEDVIVMIDLVTLAHYTELVLVQRLGRY